MKFIGKNFNVHRTCVLVFFHPLHFNAPPCSLLLFDQGLRLKLCDFGTTKKLEHSLTNTNFVGTIRYMAPEVIKGICVLKSQIDKCTLHDCVQYWSMTVVYGHRWVSSLRQTARC